MQKFIILLLCSILSEANAQNNAFKQGNIMIGLYSRISDNTYPHDLPAFGVEATCFLRRNIILQANWATVIGANSVVYKRMAFNPKIISSGLFDNQLYISNGLELGYQTNENWINSHTYIGKTLFIGFSTGLLFKPKVLKRISLDANLISMGMRKYLKNASSSQDKFISLLSPKLSINYCFSL